MITILLEEERDASKEGEKASYQDCLEFFMSNKIMEILCILGEKDVRFHHLALHLKLTCNGCFLYWLVLDAEGNPQTCDQ
jgi:hypothetical protein